MSRSRRDGRGTARQAGSTGQHCTSQCQSQKQYSCGCSIEQIWNGVGSFECWSVGTSPRERLLSAGQGHG